MKKLKLDLHTHCFEATRREADVSAVETIIKQVKARGLDGIAVTDHNYKSYGIQFKEIAEKHFKGQVLIIPGHEISMFSVEIVELFLSDGVVFRFIAHPGYPLWDYAYGLDTVQGIEIENGMHTWQIDKVKVREVAEKHGLVLLANSDAHSVEDIGKFYNEISLEELYSRARAQTPIT